MPSDELQHARDEIGKAQERRQAIRDYTDATLGDGFENASKVAKWASKIPGPAGRIFKGVQVGLETAHDLYEAGKLLEQLIVEMKQADAAEKGTEVLAKKGEDVLTKKAEKALDKILARKGVTIPEPLKKEIIKRARDYFDKNVRDPAIKAGKKELEKTIDEKDKNKSLWDVFNRGSTLYR